MLRVHSITNSLVSSNPKTKTKKKKIRRLDNTLNVKATYEVPDFNNCYVSSQSASTSSLLYIINGNLYYNDPEKSYDTILMDDSGECTTCNTALSSEYQIVYTKPPAVWCISKTDGTAKKLGQPSGNGYIKVTGLIKRSYSGAHLLYSRQGSSSGQINVIQDLSDRLSIGYNIHFTQEQPYIDVCGSYSSQSDRASYALDSKGIVYGGEGTDSNEINLCYYSPALRFKYISVDSTRSLGCFAGITTKDLWAIEENDRYNSIRGVSDFKVIQITSGGRMKSTTPSYAIGVNGELYKAVITSGSGVKFSTVETSGWSSIATGTHLQYAVGIKNGKVYRIQNDVITEYPELGDNNIKIEGVDYFLLYSEE